MWAAAHRRTAVHLPTVAAVALAAAEAGEVRITVAEVVEAVADRRVAVTAGAAESSRLSSVVRKQAAAKAKPTRKENAAHYGWRFHF